MQREDAYLLDMYVSAQPIQARTAGLSRADFFHDRDVQDIVCWHIQIIGEAAGMIPEDRRATLPDIPWRQIRAMRNIVVHRYFRLDLTPIWEVIAVDIPALIAVLEPLIPPEEEGPTTSV